MEQMIADTFITLTITLALVALCVAGVLIWDHYQDR